MLNDQKVGTIFIQSDLSIIYSLLKNMANTLEIFVSVVIGLFAYLKSKWRLKRLALRDIHRRRNKTQKPKISTYYNKEAPYLNLLQKIGLK